MLHQPVSSTVGPNFLMATASHSPLILCKSSFSPAHTKIHGFLQTSLHLLSHSRSSDKSQKKTLFRCTTLRCQAASPASNGVGSVFDLSSRIQSPTTSSLDFIRREPSKWCRVLLKVSGEALAGDGEQNVDPKITMSIAREVASVACLGIQVAIVVGGGNFFRGSTWAGCSGLDRATADYIGMTATVMNALLLQASMESIGMATRVQTAFRMSEVAEPYIRRRAIRHLEKGRVVIFAAGTGNPFFTTDTAAALRCAEIGAEVLLKATNVDGVYDKDPRLHADACLLEHITYQDIHSKSLAVMDLTAITLCQENSIPVVVFNLNKPGNIAKALKGDRVGTWIDKLRSSPGDQV